VRRIFADVKIFAGLPAVRLLGRDDTAAEPECELEGYAAPRGAERAEAQPVSDRGARRYEARRGAAICERAERRDVVEDPERAPMGAGDQIASLDLEVVDRDHRQAAGEARPALAVVEAHEHAGLGAHEEQAFPLRIGAHHAGDLSRGEI